MNIAIFTDNFLPQINGVVTAVLNLSKGLADKGHKIYIIAPKYKDTPDFEYPNIKVRYVKSGSANFIYTDFKMVSPISRKSIKFIKDNNVELIYFVVPFTVAIKGILIAKNLGIPIVGTYHTFICEKEYLRHMKLGYNFVDKLAWKYTNLYYNTCEIITCPSEIVKVKLIENHCRPPVRVISNGIEKQDSPKSEIAKIKKRINSKGPVLLFVGRLAYEKNLIYLLNCFKLILKEKPESKLVIIGDGPQKKDLQKEIRKLKLNKSVMLFGAIKYQDLITKGYYQACDIFVITSRTETFGLSVLEAQVNGLVCVGVNENGIKYLIKDNYNGFLVDSEDKIAFKDAVIKLIDNKKLYKKFKENNKKSIKKHDMKSVISTYEKTFKEVISKYKKEKSP
ncbi:MAG: glycosyltransferase [archaeon]|jgi:glycosyltransferase involved in cell wall biosynthesis